jgi:hypothetical protein
MLTAIYSLDVNRNSCGVCNRNRDAPAKFTGNKLGYGNPTSMYNLNLPSFNHALNGKQKTALRFENLTTLTTNAW